MIDRRHHYLALWKYPFRSTKRKAYRRRRQGLSVPVVVNDARHLQLYDENLLHRITNRINDCFEIDIDVSRPQTVNVLVPAFDFSSISAGFFGVFETALFIRRSGYKVRLVLFDEFAFDAANARQRLLKYPGLERLLDDLEFIYIGERKEPLRVSPNDYCVATVWYSAYFAREIMARCGDRPFLYLIQDYESAFYPSSSHYALADATYAFNCRALFSTAALQRFFIQHRIGHFHADPQSHIHFDNACSAALPDKPAFVRRRTSGGKRRLVFYSRPPVYRNMFELGALALCRAVEAGLFPADEWEFIGIGLGQAQIRLSRDCILSQMPRMALRDYIETVSTFDVGLCLMASSHPSLMPFDLSGSGAIVVTNSFGTKDQAYFDALAPGVIACQPSVEALVEGLRRAVAGVDDLDTRYANARAMTFPRSWHDSFGPAHAAFLREAFGAMQTPSEHVVRKSEQGLLGRFFPERGTRGNG